MSDEQWLQRAYRTLRSAILLIENGDPDGACNRAYYAMFHAARAALVHVGQDESAFAKTRSGMVAAFGQHLVLPGLVAAQHGRVFSSEHHRRLIADYRSSGVTGDAAQEAIDRAQALVETVEELVRPT